MFFFFKQKTAYEMRISDWSSDVCSSDLQRHTTNTGDIQPAVLLVAAPRRCKPVANLARGLVQPRARFGDKTRVLAARTARRRRDLARHGIGRHRQERALDRKSVV